MKTVTYDKSRPKLSKEIVNKKQTQTRSTLNSGRSSTNNNHKRHSHQLTYQTQLFKNINKSSTLCLNLNNHTPSSISHKVIHQNTQANPKKALSRNIKLIDQQILTKKNNKQKPSQNPSSKQKIKNSSVQSSDMNKFHSYRQSLALNYRQIPVSQRASSEEKENISPNYNINPHKKLYQNDNKPSLSKLSFILEKDFKEKTNLTKKKLLLSNQYPIIKEGFDNKQKEGFENKQKERLIKEKVILTNDDKENEIRSTSNSIKESKKSISSGRNHTIQKKKQTIRYIGKKDHHEERYTGKKDHHEGKMHVKNKLESQNRQLQRQYLKLESPSDMPQSTDIHEDKTLSIKSLLKALIDSESSAENEQSRNIRKIIDCLTTNDNEATEDERSGKLSQGTQENKQTREQLKKTSKQADNKIGLTINGFNIGQINTINQPKDILPLHCEPIINEPKIPQSTCSKHHISRQDHLQLMNIMKGYEMRIAGLYQELIEEKGKRYKLQEIIQRYIMEKERDLDRD